MTGLISPEELAAIQSLGVLGLDTEVDIYRSGIVTIDSPQYDPQYDYGDDEPYPVGVAAAGRVTTALAWFYSKLQTSISADEGQTGTIDLHEIRFAVGTDVRSRDIVRRTDNAEEYVVVDTNGDDTYQDMLRATARRRE